ncbi:MAG: urea transporter substrate-binding protein [Planctomycetota bacterium]
MLAIAATVAVVAWLLLGDRTDRTPIKVGILHSLTGTMSASESPVVDGCLLAIEQINEAGGVLGRPVEAIVRDGASDPATFAREAERLLEDDGVAAIFGCWTSASRKEVRPVVERLGGVLFYPVQYEGLEQSPRIVYLGAAPNQQIIPAVRWTLANLGKRVFLVGSDYVFPRVANAIIRDQVEATGGEVVGEAYLPLGARRVDEVVAAIVAAKPDAILNTVNGDTNTALFKALRAAGVTPASIPTISFSIGEPELAAMDASTLAGDYVAWNYFQSLDTPENEAFVEAYRERFGRDRLLSDPVEAGHLAVKLWAAAVEDSMDPSPDGALRGIGRRHVAAPHGPVSIDAKTHHAWKTARIGRIRGDGEIEEVWSSGAPMRPVPFPGWRLRSEWEQLLSDLRRGWGGSWAAPASAGEAGP